MRRTYQKPQITAERITILSALLEGSYPGEKGGITDNPGSQEDFSAKDETEWGDLW